MNTLQTYQPDTPVMNHEGDEIGTIERVIIDPVLDKVTHIVVASKGIFFSDDKVVPIAFVQSATEQAITLNKIEDLDTMPNFQDKHYVQMHNGAPLASRTGSEAVYWYPPFVNSIGTFGYAPLYGDPITTMLEVSERNIPDYTVALQDSTDVYSIDNEKVGTMEEILTDDQNRASHFVIGNGMIFKNYKVVPITWVKDIHDNMVTLAVSQDVFQQLPDYEAVS